VFDFSGPAGAVGVDPVVQVHGLWSPTTGYGWDNIRGARFRADLDGQWDFSGELLERQGVGDPRLEPWLAVGVLPGWGRPKRTAEGGYDLARAPGAVAWERGGFRAEVGHGALEAGPGMRTVLLARSAAPAPYVRARFDGEAGSVALTGLQWTGTDRLDPGSTAEPPYRWARTGVAEARTVRGRFAGTALLAVTQSGLPDRAEPVRPWGGLGAEVRGRTADAVRWAAYASAAGGRPAAGAAGAGRGVALFGATAGLRASAERWSAAAEVHLDRAAREGLAHAGLPVGLLRPASGNGASVLCHAAAFPTEALRIEAVGSADPWMRYAGAEAGWTFRRPMRWEVVAGVAWTQAASLPGAFGQGAIPVVHIGTVMGVDRPEWGMRCGKPPGRNGVFLGG
jgi:hypothetical protein